MSDNEQAVEHGVESAHYTNGYDGYKPVIRCACGFGTSYPVETWQEAGEEFDRHLATVTVAGHG